MARKWTAKQREQAATRMKKVWKVKKRKTPTENGELSMKDYGFITSHAVAKGEVVTLVGKLVHALVDAKNGSCMVLKDTTLLNWALRKMKENRLAEPEIVPDIDDVQVPHHLGEV